MDGVKHQGSYSTPTLQGSGQMKVAGAELRLVAAADLSRCTASFRRVGSDSKPIYKH